MSIDDTCSPLRKSEKPLQELLSTSNPFEVNTITTTTLEVIDQMHSRTSPTEKFHQWNLVLQNKFNASLGHPEKLQQLKELVDSISKNTYVSALSTEINQFTSLIKTIQTYAIPPHSIPIPIKYPSNRHLVLSETESDSEISPDQDDEILLDLIIRLADPTEIMEALENLNSKQALRFIKHFIQRPSDSLKSIYVIASLNFESLKELLIILDYNLQKELNDLLQTSLLKNKNSPGLLDWFERIVANILQKFADSALQTEQLSQTALQNEISILNVFQTLTQDVVQCNIDSIKKVYESKLNLGLNNEQ